MEILLLILLIVFLAYIFKHAGRDSDGTGKSTIDDLLDDR